MRIFVKRSAGSTGTIIKYLAAAICLSCICALLPTGYARADSVTDTLSVRVGYYGMTLDEYVEVGNYHWSELYGALPLYSDAYSYFQGTSDGEGRYSEYKAIVDCANGFRITDILDYANIYYGDVGSLKFYVVDHAGIQAAFDKGTLFGSRYYFRDLPGHRKVIYGEKEETHEVTGEEEVVTGYTDIVELVPRIDPETGEQALNPETGEPLYDEQVTGQTPIIEIQEVTETVTETVPDHSKIKGYEFPEAWNYSSSVAPMLAIEDNWAQFNEEFEHTGEDFNNMSASNRFRLLYGQTSPTETLTSASAKYVSRIYITLSGAPQYGDMGELDGSYGSHTVQMTVSSNTDIRGALSSLMNINSTNTDVLRVTGYTITESDLYSDLATVTINYEIVGEGTASITAGIGSESAPTEVSAEVEVGENSSPEKKQGSTDDKEHTGEGSGNVKSDRTSVDSKSVNTVDSAELMTPEKMTYFYRLSGNIGEMLNGSIPNQLAETVPTETITQVMAEDTTGEQDRQRRLLLIWTGIGFAGVCGFGAAYEALAFRRRLKGMPEAAIKLKTRADEIIGKISSRQ